MFYANIIADSFNCGSRLTTFELRYPRIIHAELMTHRVFSRNSGSSRAIPTRVMLDQVMENPFVPLYWGTNQKGMQAGEPLNEEKQEECKAIWLDARDRALEAARALLDKGLHKQIANRVLEPFSWITVIVTSSTYDNWFKLRNNKDAEPHICMLAKLMLTEYVRSSRVGIQDFTHCEEVRWHLPYVTEADWVTLEAGRVELTELVMKSVARCARGSYLQQQGSYSLDDDLALTRKLASAGHWSPFEHQAMALKPAEIAVNTLNGNFSRAWLQHRKNYPGESGKLPGGEIPNW